MAELVEALRMEGVSEETIERLLNDFGMYWENQDVQEAAIIQVM